MNIQTLDKHPEYTQQVATWLYNQWGHLSEGASIERSVSKLKARPSTAGLPLSFIAIDGSDVVGVARMVEDDMSIRPNLRPWLASVYVPPEHRHKQIGRSLCQAVVDASLEYGHKSIYLFTPDKAHFYKKQGWQTIEQIEYRAEYVTLMSYGSS